MTRKRGSPKNKNSSVQVPAPPPPGDKSAYVPAGKAGATAGGVNAGTEVVGATASNANAPKAQAGATTDGASAGTRDAGATASNATTSKAQAGATTAGATAGTGEVGAAVFSATASNTQVGATTVSAQAGAAATVTFGPSTGNAPTVQQTKIVTISDVRDNPHGMLEIQSSRTGTIKKILPPAPPPAPSLPTLRRSKRLRHCNLCSELDNSRMVQCDVCDSWFHFECVGVNASIRYNNWSCPCCKEPHISILAEPVGSSTQPLGGIAQSLVTNQAQSSLVQPENQSLVANQQQRLVSVPNATSLTTTDNRRGPQASVQDARSVSSRASSNRSEKRRTMELQLQKLEEAKAIEQKFLDMKFAILEQFGSDLGSELGENLSISDKLSQVEDWIEDTDRIGNDDSGLPLDESDRRQPINLRSENIGHDHEQQSGHCNQAPAVQVGGSLNQRSGTTGGLPPQEQGQQPPSRYPMQRQEQQQGQPLPGSHPTQQQRQQGQQLPGNRSTVRQDPRLQNPRETMDDFVPGQGSTPNVPGLTNSRPSRQTFPPSSFPHQSRTDTGERTVSTLDKSHIAARHAVSKDLQEFSGKPEDWPLFIATFNNSTQMCNFSPEENMLRLRRCLKGDALKAVSCELLHPSNVASVLSTLKMLYGRPERIIQIAILKIKQLPSPDIDDFSTVIDFALGVKNLCSMIQACEVPEFAYNVALRTELVERLPPLLQFKWADAAEGIAMPSLQDFKDWIYGVAEKMIAVRPVRLSEPKSNGKKGSDRKGDDRKADSKTRGKKESFLNVHVESEKSKIATKSGSKDKPATSTTCGVCKGSCVSADKCRRFAELSCDSKWATVKELKLCRKCLQRHQIQCGQTKPCGVDGCTFLHHPLLHNSKKAEPKAVISDTPTTSKPKEEVARSCNVHQERTSDVLFRFVPVVLYGPAKKVHTYAFIDDGSELTLLERGLADELGVQGQPSPLCLKWTGDTKRLEQSSQKVDLQIAGTTAHAKRYSLSNARTVEKLQLRPQTMLVDELKQRFRHLKGIPIESYREISPRILIGVDHAKLGHVTSSREGKATEPIGVKTCLGWCIYGCIAANPSSVSTINHHQLDVCPCNREYEDHLHKAMKDYFSLDSMGVVAPSKLLLSKENERAQKLLETLTCRKGDRYESGLLWKYDDVRLPDSRPMARKRWECLERRMSNDAKLADTLKAKISDYLSKGYIRKLSDDELKVPQARVWYLPVFPVVNPNKPDKTRMVWDAAAKAHGISLNSTLLKGPDLLTSLLIVLIKFREYMVAICGDLREMFHQVLMRNEDQHCQRFLWGRKDNSNEPNVYVMQVMTFGACCSPSTAQYVKNKHAMMYQNECPAAVRAIIEQHYVDDMLVSVETEAEAAALVHDVKRIHAEGGFEMRNWLSNSKLVLTKLLGDSETEKDLNVGETILTEKILGMWWNTSKDCFTFKLSTRCEQELLTGSRRPTKRDVLRTLMLMFDPVGFIAHFLMYLKVLLQEIWRSGISWDEEIGQNEFQKWLLWAKVLPQVENVEIPRCYRAKASITSEVQLHVFVDASENGFAAVAYLRIKDGDCIEVAFVSAKTRVAPLRFLSIPRSELQAAVLGIRLANTIIKALTIKIHKRFFYTDARDVMCWLTSDHRRYSQFVGVRASEILEHSEQNEWYWIATKLNVADEGTKWKGTADLSSTSRWFRGPDFLWKPEEDWPITSRSYGSTDEELRPNLMAHVIAAEPVVIPSNFSQWGALRRRTAFIHRCAINWRNRTKKEPVVTGPLSQAEYIVAEDYLYRLAQADAFAEEVAILKNNKDTGTQKKIPKSSSIHQVCPFLDEKAILRVRGRTGACKVIDVDAVNPVILPRKHQVTRLVVSQFHQRFHHQNHQTVVNELRQHFYIPRLKALYKKVRKECQQCKIDHATPCPPAMGDLPEGRLAAYTPPFTHTGIDYFGPITVSIGRRSEKRWGVIATCLTTRAIHLQVAYSLSTDSCIMALRNIFARRGTPAVIYSDRGTNFQGASREFREVFQTVDQNQMIKEFTSAHTEWKFNPPTAPHMGGAWERLIGTVKQNLNHILRSRVVSAEVLENTLAEVENVVNSRPLTDLPVDDDFSPVLTPNHFLLGSSNGQKPLVPYDDNPRTVGNNYKTSQILANQFWKLWVQGFLPTITRRTKWFINTKPILVGDAVIVVDPSLPRNCWPKGRIVATQPGSGGQVRSATVHTPTKGVYERPAVNLAVLDVGVIGNASDRTSSHSGGEC